MPIPLPSIPDARYIIKTGAAENIGTMSLPENSAESPSSPPGIRDAASNFFEKLTLLFHHHEIPNNINCYFMRNSIDPLKYLVNSFFILPLAVAGLILILLKDGFTSKYFSLFVYLLALAIPIAIFLPLARYRLALMPLFFIFSVRPMAFIDKGTRLPGSIKTALFALFMLSSFSISYLSTGGDEKKFRAEDFVAYGIGLERSGAKDELLEASFWTALSISPNSKSAAVHLSNQLMKNGKFGESFAVLAPFHERDSSNTLIELNFASSLLGLGKARSAEEILLKLGEPSAARSRMRYYYQLGEALRMQGENDGARNAYSRAMESAQSPFELEIVERAMRLLKN